MRRMLLELSGKNPLVVLMDADLDAAVEVACMGPSSISVKLEWLPASSTWKRALRKSSRAVSSLEPRQLGTGDLQHLPRADRFSLSARKDTHAYKGRPRKGREWVGNRCRPTLSSRERNNDCLPRRCLRPRHFALRLPNRSLPPLICPAHSARQPDEDSCQCLLPCHFNVLVLISQTSRSDTSIGRPPGQTYPGDPHFTELPPEITWIETGNADSFSHAPKARPPSDTLCLPVDSALVTQAASLHGFSATAISSKQNRFSKVLSAPASVAKPWLAAVCSSTMAAFCCVF